MKGKNLFVLSLVFCVSVQFPMPYVKASSKAEEHHLRARIDIAGHDKVDMKPGKASNGCHVQNIVWGNGDSNPFVITGETEDLPLKKWRTFTFSFYPQESGEVVINLMSNYSNPEEAPSGVINAHWIYYDSISVKGAKLLNGNFDKIDKDKGIARDWNMSPENLVKKTTKIKTASGTYMVKAYHNARVCQTIKVKADQKVTITFKARACGFVPAKVE